MAHTDIARLASQRVAETIRESGVTLVWLCGKTGIPRSTMQRSLDGLRAFNLSELGRIAEALRVDAASFVVDAADIAPVEASA